MSFKKLSVVLISLATAGLASTAYADNSTGFYIGGQAGYGQTDYGSDVEDTFTSFGLVNQSKDEDGFAGRGYVGYQFNQYFGAEVGYTYFSDNKYNAIDPYGLGINSQVTFKTQQWDVLAKLGTPFGCSGFRGDIKAGAAYVITDADVDASSPFLAGSASDSNNNWDPAAGASLSYNFNRNFAVDISYLHAFGSGNADSPNTDLVTLGVSYLFA